ncbi:Cof-type HAD-IIB family hydrolase [Anaerococcus urinomassiliensis]|uniref:Cof-type HAD-IIB family hydrolase n=1 Tax=Anaerococcus urinomassiliensis TaxID=1745712 RepID=UPI0009402970|nr:Cof-type HAD-IIB family hydrolase [Anaerococcus urinomassiliensis]
MIKLFAIDMDGTLLNSQGKLSPDTKDALQKLNESGVKSVLCSGRVATSIEYFNGLLQLDNPVIANNGAIVKINKEKVLFAHPLEDQHLKELIDFCTEHKCIYHFYDEDTFYSNSLNQKGINHLLIENDYGINVQCYLNISDDPYQRLKERNKEAYKILVGNLKDHPYGEEKIVEIFNDRFGRDLYITSSGMSSIEIMEIGVNKWTGILELADFLGISKEEIAAIGDSHNDIPMIEGAELSFAMGNANQELKDFAKYTVSDNNNAGIADAVDKILKYNKENPSV